MKYVPPGVMAALWTVFAVSAWSKIRSATAQRAFAASLRPLGLLPGRMVGRAAAAVTAAEVAIAVGLPSAFAARQAGLPAYRVIGTAALLLAAALLGVFTVVVTLAVRHGTRAPCACFGSRQRPLGPPHVIRNLLLTVLAMLGVATFAPTAGATVTVAGVLVASAAGAVLALILIHLDDMFDLFTPVHGAAQASRMRTPSSRS